MNEEKQERLEDALLLFVERVAKKETTCETEVQVLPQVAEVLERMVAMEKRNRENADYYKCGLRRWSKTPLLSRITLIVSTMALVASFVVLCMKG